MKNQIMTRKPNFTAIAAEFQKPVAGLNLETSRWGAILVWVYTMVTRAIALFVVARHHRTNAATDLQSVKGVFAESDLPTGRSGLLRLVGLRFGAPPIEQRQTTEAPPIDQRQPGLIRRTLRGLIGLVWRNRGTIAQVAKKKGLVGIVLLIVFPVFIGATAAAPPLDMARVTEHYHNVPAEMTRAVIQVESSGQPHAVSESNARGLMQMKRLAMIDAGCGHLQERVHDPIVNVWCGTKYLAQQKERFGSWRRALAAYNRGPTYFAREGFDPMAHEYIRRVQVAGGVM